MRTDATAIIGKILILNTNGIRHYTNVVYLIIGPESSSASVGSSICGAVSWCSEASGTSAKAVGSSVGGETQQQLLSRCSQSHPMGYRRVLTKRTKETNVIMNQMFLRGVNI